ncbi:tripartite tricarboxylate transporter TctB family protein [Ammoniphilus resinae]|uniref:DUF1468 domain-containing protein n=1 Tax=Ammoniphilus resinae TaxID=861532 RepID=A0ABS4GTS9_9BACL|nr:tripartite tricarboxylate transporter TctB family protein [Ammoniphilus resinae]MBP1933677.1 hypothetical protein [Ammoniphilus resinae]
MVKRYGDIYASVFLIIASIVLYISTFSIKMLTVSRIGSAFVPQLVAIGIFIFSGILLRNSLKELKHRKSLENDGAEEGGNEESQINYAGLISSVVLMIVYLLLLNSIGFLIMTTVYIVLQISILADKSEMNILKFFIIAAVSSLAVYYIFRSIFHVMLPTGILG